MTDDNDNTQNVVPLHPPRQGEPAFMRCACEPQGVDFVVVAIDQDTGPLVTALVCPSCERGLDVVAGVVQPPDDEG